ncbi:hypothetical protein Tco_0481534 [Tanacetum coccineum]
MDSKIAEVEGGLELLRVEVLREVGEAEGGAETLSPMEVKEVDKVVTIQPLCPIADRYDWEGKDEGKNSYLKM